MANSTEVPTHPPDTNRGVETHTSQQIDWISITLPSGIKDIFPNGLSTETFPSESYNAYDIAETYQDGRSVLRHSSRTDMGIHIVMSGKTCSNLRSELESIIRHAWDKGGRVTRFDLALNDHTSRIHAEDSTAYITAGEVVCRAKEYPVRTDPRIAGYSQYLGKMASEVHVCIYDKSAEQKECGFNVRVEIRFKGKKANKAASAYLHTKDCRGIILGFCDFPTWGAWQSVFSTEPVQIPADKKPSNTVAWLLGQCAMSMAKQIALDGGSLELMDEFHKAVMAYLSDLRHTTE